MPSRKDEFPTPLLIPGSVKHSDDPEPTVVDAVTDARNVDRLFVVGSAGRKTDRMTPKIMTSYKHYWTVFVDWCESNGHCPLPAAPATVLEFIKTRFDPTMPAGAVRKQTAYTMLSAIGHANVQLIQQRTLYRSARSFLKTLEDPPITLPIVNRRALDCFLGALPDNMENVRLTCVLLLIFEELLHVPEIVALRRDHYARSENLGISALFYLSSVSKEFDWHPISERTAAAIEAWIAVARISGGPLFPRLRRGRTVTSIALSKAGLAETIALAQTKWRGPRISARSLLRGRVADAVHPQAVREGRYEQRWRISEGELRYVQCRWKDEPSAMEQWSKERKLANHGKS